MKRVILAAILAAVLCANRGYAFDFKLASGGTPGATACAGLSDASAFCNSAAASNLTGALPAISGASVTALNASNLASGTVTAARVNASATGVPVIINSASSAPAVGTCNQLTAADTDIVSNGSGCTSETAIYVYSVPANTMGTTGILHLHAIGDYLNTSGGNDTFRFTAYFGGTSFATTGTSAAQASSATRHSWVVDLDVSEYGASTATQITDFLAFIGGISGSQQSPYQGAVTLLTKDTTGVLNLVLTTQLTTSNASIELRTFRTELTFYPL